jgi:hypothetical protein
VRGGRLIPGNDDINTKVHESVADDDFVVVIGGAPIIAKELPINVIRQMDEVMLSIQKIGEGDEIGVNAKFFTESGEELCQIESNRFIVYEFNVFDIDHPDPHTLTVKGLDGYQMLKVRYANNKLLFIEGDFFIRKGVHIYAGGGMILLDDNMSLDFAGHSMRLTGDMGNHAALQFGPSNKPHAISINSPTILQKMQITPEILAQYPRVEAAVRNAQREAAEAGGATHDPPPSEGEPNK